MTPQEQANSIVRKYVDLFKKSDTCFGDCKNTVACQQSWYQCEEWYYYAIESALLAVDLILTALDAHQWQNRHETVYWKEVKHEIEKL
jgi:hypothetical protein